MVRRRRYDTLATDTKALGQIVDPIAAGRLGVWKTEHLVTIDPVAHRCPADGPVEKLGF